MSTPVYRDFDQSELDAQYSPSTLVSDLDAILAGYARDSAVARASLTGGEVRYGEGPDERLDLHAGPGADRPLLLFVHGGYWQQLSKEDSTFPAPALVSAGAAYAAVDYTLCPQAQLSQIVDQVRSALVWLWRNAEAHGIARDRIVVAGSSAGAHLAAMLLVTDWSSWGLPADPIAGVVLLGGIFDLRPIRLSYVNDVVGLDEVQAQRNSPLLRSPRVRCPAVIAWGEHETAEFKRQSREFAVHWTAHGNAVRAFEQRGRNHFDSPYDLVDARSPLHREALRLLGVAS